MILIFDTETTGLFPNELNWGRDYDQFPHLVQMAWVITDDDGKELDQENHIIQPDGYTIPKESEEIHGISTRQALKEGIHEKVVLKAFLLDARKCDIIVAHNIYFDTSIIKANLLRHNIDRELFNDILYKDKRYCTMIHGQKLLGGKRPKLSELHQELFNEPFKDAHSAMGDVRAVERCYFKMRGL